ncbi:MAG: glycosyltransferase family 4 protein [Planctomycetota bacterium]
MASLSPLAPTAPRTADVGAVPTAVLYVSHEVECGGAERSLLELMAALDREHFAPALATSGEGPLTAAARRLAVPVHQVPLRPQRPGRWRRLSCLAPAVRALGRIIERERIDVVHANTLWGGYAALAAARRLGAPCVWHVRDMTYPRLARWAVRHADAWIANSQATAATIAETGGTVIHNGVDRAFFDAGERRAELRQELGLPADQLIVTMAGRLDPWKGHALLLDAMALLRGPASARVTFVVAGEVTFTGGRSRLQDYVQSLRERAESLGVASRVRWLGRCDDVPRLLAGSDVLVHPSVEPEPFGRSIAEAQAAGLAVVGANHGGIPELIDDDVDGLLFRPRDPAALAAALHRALEDAALRQRLGKAARDRARRTLRSEMHARAVEGVYRRALAGAGRLRAQT